MTLRGFRLQHLAAILLLMVVTAVVALLLAPQPLSKIDALAKARDDVGLRKLVTIPAGVPDPFRVLRTNGAYEVGRFGWRAHELNAPDGKRYVVIGTPLTSEDMGEIVLRRDGDRLVYVPETDPLGVTLKHHRFDLRFDVPKKRAELIDRMTFRSEGKGTFLFRMSPAYRVSRIEDGQGKPVRFVQASGVVAVNRPASAEATYTIHYGGVVDLPRYAGSISDQEATLVNDYWYPMVARQPTTYEIAIRAPEGWTPVAQGDRVPSSDGVIRYRMDLPVTYFSVLAAPFQTVEEKIDGRTYRVWSTRMERAAMVRHTQLTAPIVEYYAKVFGWPFEGFGAVDSRQYGGGALEAYSFATYGGGLPGEDAHEPAHTLWGGVINNTYLKSFWNESFAVFSDGLFHREAPIGNVAERRLAYVQVPNVSPAYNDAPMADSGAHIGPLAGELGYGKGAYVLQMLEQWIGTEALVGAMRAWLETHPKGKPGEWEDFERVLVRRLPDRDIKGFFDDWVRRPGYADFDASVRYANNVTTVQLKWQGPRFRMPLTVLVRDASAKERTITFWLDGKSDAIRIPGPKPSLVSIDPWRQAVRPIAADESPVRLASSLRRVPKLVDPKHPDWLASVGGRGQPGGGDVDPAGKFLVGSPESWPLLRGLCEKVGFTVSGNQLTYQGTTIDLREGAALAVVDLGDGKRCVLGLGKTEHPIDYGEARLIVTDRLGRFLRGVTEPKTSGTLTFKP